MNKQTKTFRAPFEFKADSDETGEFSAEFATLNVIDHDKDVTPEGAFQDGQEAFIEPWNHGWDLPVGKGVIREEDGRAKIDGKFFIDTTGGLDHYRTVKNAGTLSQWSYTFQVLESSQGDFEGEPVRYLKKLDVVGVSPVTRGAGIDTRTTAIKEQKETQPEDNEDEAGNGKSSENLMAEINIVEIEVIKTNLEV